MTEGTSKAIEQELEQERKELQHSLDRTLEQDIRQGWRVNTIAWLAVTFGAFALNLLVLLILAGG